jgi:maleylacetate reductase
MVVSTGGRGNLVDSVRKSLGSRIVETFDRAVAHVPEEIARSSLRIATDKNIDCIITLGGSSSIGVAKAIALTLPVPIVAVPTTYGGSEMTSIWGLTREGRKETGRNPQVQPKVVIYDPDLTLNLPARTSACSGLNAIAHCVESLYAPDANPLSSLAGVEGIRLLSSALPRIAASLVDRDARADALKGAWLAGFALGTVQMGLHHKLCHTLGGAFDLPHADTHAVLLPYTTAYNREAAHSAMRAAAAALEVEDTPSAILNLAREIEAPLSLREIGMNAADLDRAADLAVERQYPNPRPVTRNEIRDLLFAAYDGDGAYVSVAA